MGPQSIQFTEGTCQNGNYNDLYNVAYAQTALGGSAAPAASAAPASSDDHSGEAIGIYLGIFVIAVVAGACVGKTRI